MTKKLLILLTLFTISVNAWESGGYIFGESIDCENLKMNNTKDEQNFNYQKCIVYKTTFDKYLPIVEHYNLKNKLGAKYEIKWVNIHSEYMFKKYIYDNLKNNQDILPNSLTYSMYKWQANSLGDVYKKIVLSSPTVIQNYKIKVSEWFKNGEGKSFTNDVLLKTHQLRQKNVEEGILMKYQYRLNTSYTSLLEIETELIKRNMNFNQRNFLLEF